MRLRYALVVSLVLAASAAGQTPGDCDTGRASGTLDASDVEATVLTTGTIAYGPGAEHAYYVPKGSRLSPLYAASVWVGGRVGGEFRVAAATYGQGGRDNDHFEFWPGPLDAGAVLPDPDDCSAYDRVWVVSVEDVDAFDVGGVVTTRDLAEWPVGLGAPAVDAEGAPVVPESRGQRIDLGAGERPVLSGSQTAFWVMNDVGNEHRTSGSAPLGIEVAVTAFVVARADSPTFHRAVFARYAITNRNDVPIEDAYATFWADPDLGNAGDDYVGIDTTRSLAFVYNADEVDDGFYGAGPPAWGADVLGGLADDDRQREATAFTYSPGGDANRGDPGGDPIEFHNIMRGIWRDGTPITALGSGYNQGGDVTTFAFPGDPALGQFWSEEQTGRGRAEPGERRFVVTTGPGTIGPGETRTVDYAFLFMRERFRLLSVEALQAASDTVQAVYDAGNLFETVRPVRPPPPTVPILAADLVVRGQTPGRGLPALAVRLLEASAARVRVIDALGRVVYDDNRRRWPAGETAVDLGGLDLAAGAYTALLEVRGGAPVARRLVVVR